MATLATKITPIKEPKMVNKKTMKRLRNMVYREHAGEGCNLWLDHPDSLVLASAFYNVGIEMYYPPATEADIKGLSFAEFIVELKDGDFDELRFRRLGIKWFCPETKITHPLGSWKR